MKSVVIISALLFGSCVMSANCNTVNRGTTVLGITGEISKLETAVPAKEHVSLLDDSKTSEDIDLRRMAEWALHYLAGTPRKELDYEPVFNCFTLQCPPTPQGHDPVVPCDTDARMDWEWYYMRDITGSTEWKDVEAAFHKRMRSYMDSDGIVWSEPGCYHESMTDAVYKKEDRIIHMWGATKILRGLSEDYTRTKDPESKALARKVMLALKGLATWDDKGRCWFTCGMGGLKADRTPAEMSAMPAPIVGSLVTYWKSTGDPEGLAFAKAYAEGIVNNLQPNGIKFQPDGNFGSGHGHITMHSVWGVAELGLATKDSRYIDFAKRSCDWMMARGTGTGWFPAAPEYAQYCTEVCCISDMMSTAACIAKAGHPEYYDYVERCMRNYISNLQFISTPEFEARYAEVNKAQGSEKVKAGLEEVRKFQGGFYNAGLNDYENTLLGGGGYVWKLAGCCVPEGMRSVHTTWTDTIYKMPKSPLGPAGVYVNMSFSRDSEWGRVVSFLPDDGRLTVKAVIRSKFFLRPPHWVERDQVRAFVDGKAVPVKWSGSYVQFSAKPGQELTVSYPLIRFEQKVKGIWPNVAPNLEMTFDWLGNMVVSASPAPAAGNTPLFTGKVHHLPEP